MTGHEDYDRAELEWLPRGVARIIRRAHGRIHTYHTFHEILEDLEQLRAWD